MSHTPKFIVIAVSVVFTMGGGGGGGGGMLRFSNL